MSGKKQVLPTDSGLSQMLVALGAIAVLAM